MPDFILDSLRGGLDNFTPITLLDKASCTVAENVEFFYSALGERRGGTDTFIGVPAALVADANFRAVASMFVYDPGPTANQMELWICARMSTTQATMWVYPMATQVWAQVTFPSVADAPLSANAYDVYGQGLHGKFFIAYRSAVDRLHVRDAAGTFRRVGLAANNAPTAANQGAGAYAAVLRFYRTRSVLRSGGVVLVRSEPSPAVSFTPSGANGAARVARAALPGESETDWELEGSLDGGAYAKIATIAAATTFYDDTTLTTTYNTLLQSDPIGTYALIPSIQLLSALDDRLILGGAYEITADNCAVRWTPVGNDPSPGPDERLNAASDPRDDLDAQEGGGLTAMSPAVEGEITVFKNSGIYVLQSTGQLVGAYAAHCLTKARGALAHSVIAASDEAGHPATYFVDPKVGAMRVGGPGVQYVGQDVQAVFQRLTKGTDLGTCHGVYHGDKQQIHYWIAVDASTTPSMKLTLQTNLITADAQGNGTGGWSISPVSQVAGQLGYAACSAMFPLQAGLLRLVPFVGHETVASFQYGTAASKSVQRFSSATDDAGVAYVARLRTRPFFLATILNQHGVNNASLLGLAGSIVKVTAIRDFGVETLVLSADMTAVGSETHVIAHLDNFNFSELYALQLEFADLEPGNPTQWQLFMFAAKETDGATA